MTTSNNEYRGQKPLQTLIVLDQLALLLERLHKYDQEQAADDVEAFARGTAIR